MVFSASPLVYEAQTLNPRPALSTLCFAVLQVKIHGFRVELGAMEKKLAAQTEANNFF